MTEHDRLAECSGKRLYHAEQAEAALRLVADSPTRQERLLEASAHATLALFYQGEARDLVEMLK